MQHVWERSPYRALVGKPEGKRYQEDADTNGRIILTFISDK
jgi:hypothetical protein